MDRHELESPLSLPTAKLEQCDTEYMKKNFNISQTAFTVSMGFWGTIALSTASLDQTRMCKGINSNNSINLGVAISDASFPSLKSQGSICVNNYVTSSIRHRNMLKMQHRTYMPSSGKTVNQLTDEQMKERVEVT